MTASRRTPWPRTVARVLLGGLLVTSGFTHLIPPGRGYRVVVPRTVVRTTGLPPDTIVEASGLIEIVLGAAILLVRRRRRRRDLSLATAAFFVAVFPGNVSQWRTGRSAPMLDTDRRRGIRLLLQPLLVVWALWAVR